MVKTQYYNYSFHSKGIHLSALVVYYLRHSCIKLIILRGNSTYTLTGQEVN